MDRSSLCILLIGMITLSEATPHPHHGNDPYTPVIDFLKQLRKARKHSGSIIGNREGEEGTLASTSSNFNNQQQQPQQSQAQVPILFPQDSSASQSSSGSSGGGDQRITIQLPSNLNVPPATSSPQDILRVNNGVSTILSGVRSFDLGQILRGAFIFPGNENVKSVANNVLDQIFGPPGGGAGDSKVSSGQN